MSNLIANEKKSRIHLKHSVLQAATSFDQAQESRVCVHNITLTRITGLCTLNT